MTHPDMSEQATAEPIAIVGLACRVPGAADAGELWHNLVDGVDAGRRYTINEQRALGVAEHELQDPSFVPVAMALDDHDAYDDAFFGIPAREAQIRDPQQRLFLELAYNALEDAGYDSFRYPGEIGVYAGVGPDVYQWDVVRKNKAAFDAAGWLAVTVGNLSDYCATFASYKLDLRGPSLTLHTACSTALVAMHIACEALRNGECDMALTGGSTVDVFTGRGYVYEEGGINSPDGRCRSFDAEAKGTIWGSGGGVVVLKRLSEALADGDCVRAVVLGNAINNDGSSKAGFSAPSVEGQSAVVAQALGVAGIDPRTIGYVEAHGTATSLGDPIEVAALASVFGRETDERGWCGIGSIKSNIGHLGQAAGVLGVIKTVLALEHRVIPASLHYRTPNPKIDFESSPFYVVASLTDWHADGSPRRAGVSSFGFGGTNSHVVLEEAPEREPAPPDARSEHLLQLSARTESALQASVERLAAHLADNGETNVADVAHTLRVGRRLLPRRAAVVATDAADAVAALADPKRLIAGSAAARVPRVALLFSGQGSQYAGMGAGLHRSEPVFRDAVDDCAGILEAELGEDLRPTIFAAGDDTADERLRQTALTQPALFVVEYALARLWQSWGVEPEAMIGHSSGEYVAACLAGVLALPDALRLVSARGRLMQELPPGGMLAVRLDEEEARELLPDGVSVATVNGPGTCVLSGPAEAVDALASRLEADGVGATRLRTSHAFHSEMMEPILGEFRRLAGETELRAPALPFLSNVTGTWITREDATDPSYWARHLRETVRFGDCVSTLLADGDWAFVECGPGHQLCTLAGLQVPRDGIRPLASLPGAGDEAPDLRVLYTAAGTLWSHGVPLEGFGAPGRRVPLPTYPWERKRAWIEPEPEAAADRTAVAAGPRSLGDWFSVPVWRQLPAAPPPARLSGRWLAFLDEGSAGLGAALRAAGAEVVEVRPGAEYRREAGRYVLRPAERDDYDRLVGDLAAEGFPSRVVHAWTAAREPAGADAEGLRRAQDVGFFSLLSLVQALAATGGGEPVRLDLVTSGTTDVTGGDLVRPEHATVAGIERVVPLELPWLTIRRLEVDPAGPDWAAAAEELARPAEEAAAAIAHRAGRRWVEEHEPVAVPAADGALPEGGVYLVTGGLGGVGITLAEDLAGRARARLVLLSRSGLPPREEWDAYLRRRGTGDPTGRAIAAVRRMEEAGAEVLVLAADVTEPSDLRRVREEALARFRRIDVVVHAAGVAGGGMAEVKERTDAERVLAPKLEGTLALREAFGDLDLEAVFLCSSVTAVAGGFGQVDYCAANRFLDAHARGAHGWRCRVVALDWDAWRDVGMAAEVSAPAGFRALQRGEAAADALDHPVLTEIRPGDPLPSCAGTVSATTHWVLDEHRMETTAVMPGTAYVDLARHAAEAVLPGGETGQRIELRDLTIFEPLAVPDGVSAEVRVLFSPDADGAEWQLTSEIGGETRVHARGGAAWIDPEPAPTADLEALRARCARAEGQGGMPLSVLFSYGPRWQNLTARSTGDGEALALLEANEVTASDLGRWVVHPGMLDEAISLIRLDVDGHYLPLGYGRVVAHAPMPARAWSHVRVREGDSTEVLVADVSLYDETGAEVLAIEEYMLRRIDPDAVLASVTAAPTADPAAQEPGRGIAPGDGAEAFRRLLATDLGPQVTVTEAPLPELVAEVRALTHDAVEELEGPGAADATDETAQPETNGHAAPRSELEAAVASLFGEVLGGSVGVDEDFFELGGNSLVAVQLTALIRKEMDVRLPMRSLFEARTVEGVAALVEASGNGHEEDAPAADDADATRIPRLAR